MPKRPATTPTFSPDPFAGASSQLLMPLGRRIQQVMQRCRIEQSELAAKRGVTQGAVSQHLTGVRVPSPDMAAQIILGLAEIITDRWLREHPKWAEVRPHLYARVALAVSAAVSAGATTADAGSWAAMLDLNPAAVATLPTAGTEGDDLRSDVVQLTSVDPDGVHIGRKVHGYDIGIMIALGARGYSYADVIRNDEQRRGLASIGGWTLTHTCLERLELLTSGMPVILLTDPSGDSVPSFLGVDLAALAKGAPAAKAAGRTKPKRTPKQSKRPRKK